MITTFLPMDTNCIQTFIPAADRSPGSSPVRGTAMLILNRLQVESLLDVDALIDALASAMADLSAGRASVPDRVAALVPGHETGACSALSARLLARPDADVLAILGTGVQARSHARAMCRVMPIRQIRVAGRDYAKAAALAAELSDTLQTDAQAVGFTRRLLRSWPAPVALVTLGSGCPGFRRSSWG